MDLITKNETNLLKGIAILMVMIEHIGQAFHIGIVNPLGPLGVFLFLFLSGYGLSCSYREKGKKNYFYRKLLKVYCPYAFAVILFLIWNSMIHVQFSGSTVAKYLILLALPQGSFWYLILLFFWYIVFYLLTPVYKKTKLLIVLMLLASFAITWLEGFSRGYAWQFISFPLGVLVGKFPDEVYKHFANVKAPLKNSVLLIIAVLMVVLKKTVYVEMHELGFVDTFLQIGITLTLGIWLILNRELFEKNRKIKTLLIFIGCYSYQLYLSHVLPLDWLKNNATIYCLMVYVLVTVIGAALITLFIRGLNYSMREVALIRGE